MTFIEFLVWLIILGGLLLLLLIPMNENSSIFTTNYTLSLLMPVMLWGAMRFGYRLTSSSDAGPAGLYSLFYRYIPVNQATTFNWRSPLPATRPSFVVVYMCLIADPPACRE